MCSYEYEQLHSNGNRVIYPEGNCVPCRVAVICTSLECVTKWPNTTIMKSRSLFATLLCYIWSTLLVPGEAIIIHPKVPDSSYVTNVANVPFFVSLGQRGDCAGSVVVGSAAKNLFYVISAAHCFCNNKGRKTSHHTTVIFSDGSKVTISFLVIYTFVMYIEYKISVYMLGWSRFWNVI